MTSSDKLFKTKLKVPLDIDFEKDLYLAELLLKEDNFKMNFLTSLLKDSPLIIPEIGINHGEI